MQVGGSGAGRSQCFMAPAGKNSSKERKFRGFNVGVAAKLPFGRAPSEAAHGAMCEALPKGL
jgi:hypothetical protein